MFRSNTCFRSVDRMYCSFSVSRFGRTRTTVGLDLYNITNSNAILTYNQTFVATTDTWLRPNSVLQARFAKFSAQIDF